MTEKRDVTALPLRVTDEHCATIRASLERLAFLERHRGHNDKQAKAAMESLERIQQLTYDRTPVDALISDLCIDAMLDALEPEHVQDRIKEFGIEIGELDADGKPTHV